MSIMSKEAELSKDVGRTNEKKRHRENKNYTHHDATEARRRPYDVNYSYEKKKSLHRKHSNERDSSHERKHVYKKKNSQNGSNSHEKKSFHEKKRSYHRRHSYDTGVSYERRDSHNRRESHDQKQVGRKRHMSNEKTSQLPRYSFEKDRSTGTVVSRNGRRSRGEKRSRSRRHLHVRHSSHSSRLSSVEKPSVEKVPRRHKNSSYEKRTNFYDSSSSDVENPTYFHSDNTKKSSHNKITLSLKRSSQEKSDCIDVNVCLKEKKFRQSGSDEKKRDCKGADVTLDQNFDDTSHSVPEKIEEEESTHYKTIAPSRQSVNRRLSPNIEHTPQSTSKLSTDYTDSYENQQKEILDKKEEYKPCEDLKTFEESENLKTFEECEHINANACDNCIAQDRGDPIEHAVKKHLDSSTQKVNTKDDREKDPKDPIKGNVSNPYGDKRLTIKQKLKGSNMDESRQLHSSFKEEKDRFQKAEDTSLPSATNDPDLEHQGNKTVMDRECEEDEKDTSTMVLDPTLNKIDGSSTTSLHTHLNDDLTNSALMDGEKKENESLKKDETLHVKLMEFSKSSTRVQSIENKKTQRLEKIRKLMDAMKEKGLLKPPAESCSQEIILDQQASVHGVSRLDSEADDTSTVDTSFQLKQINNKGVNKALSSNDSKTLQVETPGFIESEVVLDADVTSDKETEKGNVLDSLDAYMEIIATEIEEVNSAGYKKSSRRKRKKGKQSDVAFGKPDLIKKPLSITLEEILDLQKQNASLLTKEMETLDDSSKATSKTCLELYEAPFHTSLTDCSKLSIESDLVYNVPETTDLSAIDAATSLDCLENVKIVDASLEDNEDAYHEQFIAAIREHSNNVEEKKTCDAIEDIPTLLENKCDTEVKVEEKSEVLDNLDDEDYRYNLGNDGATQNYFDLVQKVGNKKEFPAVDHSTIDYPPIEKNIYVQVREITLMKDHEIEALRKLHSGIRVRGKHCPRPILNFYQCGLPNGILKIIEKKEFETPFPIQMQAIPALMAGRDVIAIAETGSGKTLAYLLPLVRHVLHQPPLRTNEGPIGLVLAPTRELAVQIQREAHRYTKATGLRSTSVYGGTGIGEQLSALKRGSEIVIGTPGRLIDVLTINCGKILNLRRVTFCILDEADRMFDMGFEPQIMSILKNIRPDRQTALFSATFPPVIESLARRILQKPLEISVGNKGQTASRIEQYIEVWTNYREKFLRLLQLLGEWNDHGSIIIFVSKQNEADELFAELLKYGYPSFVLHGGQDQADRDFTVQDFKEGSKAILVATSVAARGLDVMSVVLVINFVAPDHLEDYVHRIGRTGRAGNIGVAYTFLLPQEGDKAEDLIKALKQSQRPVPEQVQELADEFRAKCNMGLACQHKKKGFRGKGFKFTAAEQSRQQQERQRVKKQLGMNESDNEDDATILDGDDFENPMAPMPPVPTSAPATPAVPLVPTGDVETAFVRAKALAELIAKQGAIPSTTTITTPPTTTTPPLPVTIHPIAQIPSINPPVIPTATSTTALEIPGDQKSKQVASLRTTLQQQLELVFPMVNPALNASLGMTQRALSISNSVTAAAAVAAATAAGLSLKGSSGVGFPSSTGNVPGLSSMAYIDQATGNAVDEFEINDYPQYARFKIMHKDILHRIADQTSAVLQVKGRYISTEEKDSPISVGVKRLYIEIIGATPIIVQRAKHEIRTLLEAVSLKQLNVGATVRPPGRYSVI
ncbi:probable ATP-dependent RNA helicase DDX46 [Hylaeus volcanicus]|uniref:probable ATP-dependent RNA helicase DDX46 n=1 Tax=Hylaeus volcanicus TaxID=313075 RepID=UPI0023B79A45|nr:probable ATP-dependent RNA helicase DDX46 [Hylaeus volcanicus]